MEKKGKIKISSENMMPIIKKWLYSDKDIFLREIVANGVDAMTKHKKLVDMGETEKSDDEYKIQVFIDEKEKTLTVEDNGIGMTAEEVEKYITQIAFSGAEDFLKKYENASGDGIIGHFGLGFYSAYMVSERVEIFTKSYKDEPAVAAYDLLNRPLHFNAEWENKLDTLHKFYRRIYKAIRNVGDNHIVIMQAPFDPDTLPPENEYHSDNVAYGLYSHFRTTFETDSLVNGIRSIKSRNIPFVICKIRSEENLDYSLTALNDTGVSWFFGDYKGCGDSFAYIWGGNISPANLTHDSYETIGEKWSKPIATKNFTENKETAKILKRAFKYGEILTVTPKSENKNKFRIKVKFGFNVVKGMN